MLSVPHLWRLSVFFSIIWNIKSSQYTSVFRLGVIIFYIASKSEIPALTFQPNIPEMGVNLLLDVCAQHHGIDHEFPVCKSGESFQCGCNSLPDLVMTALKCCQLLSFLHGCYVCSPFGKLYLLFVVFWEGQQTSEGSWGQWQHQED